MADVNDMEVKPRKPALKRVSFKEDYRVSNPSLHLFYVKSAVVILTAMDKASQSLGVLSNTQVWPAMSAIQRERDALVSRNAAFADADEIMRSIGLPGGGEE